MTLPSDIATLDVWYKADAITGLSDADPLSAWTDSSGNGYTTSQSTSSLRPTYKTVIINSLPVVRFGTSGDTALNSSASSSYAAQTIFAVIKPTNTSGTQMIRGGITGSLALRLNAGKIELLRQGVTVIGTGSTTVPTTGASIITASYDQSTGDWAVYLNGAADGSGTNNVTLTASGATTLGADGAFGGDAFAGDMGEEFVFSTVLGSADRDSMVAYLASKWNITTPPPPVPSDTFELIASAPPSGSGLDPIIADSSVDDHDALQAQLDWVHSEWGGGAVIVRAPGRTVRCDSGLTVPAGVQLVSDEKTLFDFSNLSSGVAITVSDSNFTPLIGLRLEGGMTSPTTSDYTSTYTGIKATGNGLRFERLHVKYFGRGIDLATSNTWAVKFVGGIAENCAIGAYIDHETAGTSNSGEELVFDGFDFANNVRAWWATGNGTDVQFSNLSMDFSSGDIGKVNNAQIYIRGCHVETSAGSYVFDVTGNTQFHASDTRFTLGQMLLFKTAQGPANYGFGKAAFEHCEAFFTDDTSTSQNVSSELILSWPATTTSMNIYVPWPLKGWCAIGAEFVNLDAYYVPNDDHPLITARYDLTGELTITAPSNAADRFIRLKF